MIEKVTKKFMIEMTARAMFQDIRRVASGREQSWFSESTPENVREEYRDKAAAFLKINRKPYDPIAGHGKAL